MSRWQRQTQQKQDILQKKTTAGLVSERLKGVSAITIGLTYYQRPEYATDAKVLMCRTLYVLPEDYAYFDMPCMAKECDGSFDLNPVIKTLVKDSKRHAKGSLPCSGTEKSLPERHASVNYDISITYDTKASA